MSIRNAPSILTACLAMAIFATSPLLPRVAQGEDQIVPLTPEAMVQRCYGQLVRKRAPKDHPILQQVRAGTLSAIDACMQILSKGDLVQQSEGSTYRLANTSDPEARAVLKTMHNLHRSWLPEAKLPDEIYASIDHHYDYEAAIGFFTNALFGPNVPYRSVVTDNRDIRILREERFRIVNLNAPMQWHDSADIEQGEITGLSFFPAGSTTWKTMIQQDGSGGVDETMLTMRYNQTIHFQSKRSYGAGLLGLASFIWGHIGYPIMRSKADGGERIPRRWAVHVYSGLLCRNMPFLRMADVSAMVAQYIQRFPDSATHIPFRDNAQCMRCHAAQDPLGAALRNITFTETDLNPELPNEERQRHIYLERNLPTSADEQAGLHLVPPTPDFYKTPPNFKLYYRSYDGTLVNESYSASDIADALTQLGQALSAKDDFYMCVASRYFNFFTGIQVNLADYQDPANGGTITDADMHYRETVKSLALALKTDPNQSLKTLIRNIFSLPLYQSEGMRDQKP